MSKELYYRNVVTSSKGTVVIDTRHTFDGYYETMVFKCDSDGNIDWLEIDCDRYPSADEMEAGHQRMIEKWRV